MGFIDRIASSDDVKKFNINELSSLSEELRSQILVTIEKNGGHLASNLGIIEATVALYHVFDFPKDKLIFDVGHQCYAHKILSGRKEKFSSIRMTGGISGFPDRKESEYDAFSVGHAGTAIASGLGYCSARDNLGEDYLVINVVGDGALANGLSQEALTATASKPKNYILILNDNGMSISKNRNGFYQYISKGTTKRGYIGSKRVLKKVFGDSFITKGLIRFRDFIKRIVRKNNYFEQHGFKYVGVVDGNNIKELVKIFKRIKEVAKDKAVFLHLKTTKGKGYFKAEEHSDLYHGVGKNFECENGEFSLSLGNKINSLIDKDKKIVAITAAMKDGTGLSIVEEKHPNNFYDVGIAEEYAVTFAAGMAMGGLKPIVAIYSTFLQRSYDQILHDVCLQNLPVVFCIDRAGFVGRDGKTHQGVFDLSYLTHLPNLTVLAPTTTEELCLALDYALSLNSPVAIRYPKNSSCERKVSPYFAELWQTVKEGDKVAILAVGPRTLELGLQVCDKVKGVRLISARAIKPLCEKTLLEIKDLPIITLEENSVIGGFGASILSYYSAHDISAKVVNIGVEDKFIEHGSIENQFEDNGLTVENILSVINKI